MPDMQPIRNFKVSLHLPVDRVDQCQTFGVATGITEIAQAAEAHGYDAIYVTDHPAPDQRWLDGGGHHGLDPIAALSAAAVVTSKIRLHTNVYVLPYRNPFLVAKSLASVDVISGGRLIAGVAAGYLKPEFLTLGRPFDQRGALLEEALQILPRIWSETSLGATGIDWHAHSVTALPHPTNSRVPIWVGGNSRAAMRRAVEYGSGWSPFPTPVGSESYLRTDAIPDIATLVTKIEQFRERSAERGHVDELSVCFVPWSQLAYLQDPSGVRQQLCEEIFELVSVGVDWIAVSCPGGSPRAVIDESALLADALGQMS